MMPQKPNIDDFDKVLVVEGNSDLYFYAEAIEHVTGRNDTVYIQQFNGADDLMQKLETFLSPGLLAQKESIGVIVDADEDAAARIQSLQDTLRRITKRELEHGVWSEGSPRLGFFVTPDGNSPGEVETLVWTAWSRDAANAEAVECVNSYLDCMDGLGLSADSPDKGRIGAVLAVRNDEDPRLGPGARANVFDFDRPEFGPLLNFLRGL